MNIITKIGSEIKEINTNFLLNLENYAHTYYNTLDAPTNEIYRTDLARKNGILQKIDSKAFTVKNQMNTLLDKMSQEMDSMNDKLSKLKRENKILRDKSKDLHRAGLTADGLYDGELDWYREQVKIVIVMLIGVVVGTFIFKQLKLTIKETLIAVITVIILGTFFTKIANVITSTIKSAGYTMIGKQYNINYIKHISINNL
jgi:Skp family chaperone for outer membrane proteins